MTGQRRIPDAYPAPAFRPALCEKEGPNDRSGIETAAPAARWPWPVEGRAAADSEQGQLAALARAEYAARRRRDGIFRASIFAEPAWDMLLDLYVQHHRGRPVSVHSLCIAAAVPPTTALRWIGKLHACGLVTRRPSHADQRVVHVALSRVGVEEMESWLRDRLRQIGDKPSQGGSGDGLR